MHVQQFLSACTHENRDNGSVVLLVHAIISDHREGDEGHGGPSMGPNNGQGDGVSSEGGSEEGHEGVGGVGFRGNLWKGVDGGDGMGIK